MNTFKVHFIKESLLITVISLNKVQINLGIKTRVVASLRLKKTIRAMTNGKT